MFTKSTLISTVFALATLALPSFTKVESHDTCVTLSPGQYTISAAGTKWQLRPFHHSHAPPAIDSQATPPTGQLGVWTLSNAPQSAYYIGNVGEGNVVSTLQYGGNPQPYTLYGGPAVAFAIQCAGGGTYVIKNPVADEVWTAEPSAFVKWKLRRRSRQNYGGNYGGNFRQQKNRHSALFSADHLHSTYVIDTLHAYLNSSS